MSFSSCISHNSRSYMSNPSLNGQLDALYKYTKHLYQILTEIAEKCKRKSRTIFLTRSISSQWKILGRACDDTHASRSYIPVRPHHMTVLSYHADYSKKITFEVRGTNVVFDVHMQIDDNESHFQCKKQKQKKTTFGGPNIWRHKYPRRHDTRDPL